MILESLSSPAKRSCQEPVQSLGKAALSLVSPHFTLLKAIREPKWQALGHLTFAEASTELT